MVLFWTTLHGLQNSSSPTKDQTWALEGVSMRHAQVSPTAACLAPLSKGFPKQENLESDLPFSPPGDFLNRGMNRHLLR